MSTVRVTLELGLTRAETATEREEASRRLADVLRGVTLVHTGGELVRGVYSRRRIGVHHASVVKWEAA